MMGNLQEPTYAGPERRKQPRVLPYHPDDTRTWFDAGRKLILTTTRFPGSGYLRLVLCQIIDEHKDKFVTWMENIADSERVGHPATFGGDYFDDLKDAVASMYERAGKNQVKVVVP